MKNPRHEIYHEVFKEIVAGEAVSAELLRQWKMSVLTSLEIAATDAQIDDMIGFIKWSKDNGQTQGYISSNLIHDISGIGRDNNPGFSPRTAGYSKFLGGK